MDPISQAITAFYIFGALIAITMGIIALVAKKENK